MDGFLPQSRNPTPPEGTPSPASASNVDTDIRERLKVVFSVTTEHVRHGLIFIISKYGGMIFGVPQSPDFNYKAVGRAYAITGRGRKTSAPGSTCLMVGRVPGKVRLFSGRNRKTHSRSSPETVLVLQCARPPCSRTRISHTLAMIYSSLSSSPPRSCCPGLPRLPVSTALASADIAFSRIPGIRASFSIYDNSLVKFLFALHSSVYSSAPLSCVAPIIPTVSAGFFYRSPSLLHEITAPHRMSRYQPQ
jgi:hypothetical protein